MNLEGKRKDIWKDLDKECLCGRYEFQEKSMFFEFSIDVLDQYYFEDYNLHYHTFSMTITPTRVSENSLR